jgi:hypothetical protein
MGTKMLSTSSPLLLISLPTFLATCLGNTTLSPHLTHFNEAEIDSMFLYNTDIHLQPYTASQPRIQYSLDLVIYNLPATHKVLLNPTIK